MTPKHAWSLGRSAWRRGPTREDGTPFRCPDPTSEVRPAGSPRRRPGPRARRATPRGRTRRPTATPPGRRSRSRARPRRRCAGGTVGVRRRPVPVPTTTRRGVELGVPHLGGADRLRVEAAVHEHQAGRRARDQPVRRTEGAQREQLAVDDRRHDHGRGLGRSSSSRARPSRRADASTGCGAGPSSSGSSAGSSSPVRGRPRWSGSIPRSAAASTCSRASACRGDPFHDGRTLPRSACSRTAFAASCDSRGSLDAP